MSVIGLLECVVVSLQVQLPFVNEITIQSDNATTYQNGHIVFGIHLLNIKMRGKIFIADFIHSETQHGKTILDAHFASTNRHLKNFMMTYKQNRITRIQTSQGLAYALSFNSGVKNTVVQLIELSETTLTQIATTLDPIVKKGKEYFSRVNHIFFEKLTVEMTFPNELFNDLSLIPKFTLRIQAFSDIDDPYPFEVDFKQTSFTPCNIDTNNDQVHSNNNPALDHHDQLELNDNIMDDTANDTSDDPDDTSNHQPEECSVNVGVQRDLSFFVPRGHNTTHNLRNKKSIVDIENTINNQDTQNEEDHDSLSSSDEEYFDSDDYDSDSDEGEVLTVREHEIRQYGPPTDKAYDVTRMISGTKILKLQDFGNIAAFVTRNKKTTSINLHNIVMERRDYLAKAVRYANRIISSSQYFHDKHDSDSPLYNLASEFTPTHQLPFHPSWARRGGYGELYGETYMEEFKDELLKLFRVGCADHSKKMNPAKMREHLVNMFPHKFSIPSEMEIKKFINSESQKLKYKSRASNNPNERRGRKQKGAKSIWISALEVVMEANPNGKTEEVYNAFIVSLGEDVSKHPADLPRTEDGEFNKKTIKSVMYQLRSKSKKNAKKSLI